MGKAVVIGAGVMGTAVAVHLANNNIQVKLWGTHWDTENLKKMENTRRHNGLDVELPRNITLYYEAQLEEAIKDTRLIIIAVSSNAMGGIIKTISPYLSNNHYILSITKGIEEEKLYTMSQVIEESLPSNLQGEIPIIKLGGPLIAKELAQGKYSEGVLASKNLNAAEYAKKLFNTPKFKMYTLQDIEGVDICAAFKNVYAIGMGIVETLEEGSNNIKAALMARGTLEMGNIVAAYGGDRQTAYGVAGLGDYYVTSQSGRNGIFGRHLGKGKTAEGALKAMAGITVEGYAAILSGYKFLQKLERDAGFNIKRDTPLFQELYNIVYNKKSVREAIDSYWLSDQ